MAGTGAGYDLSVTTYSPDGRVFQVEYAKKGVEKSGTALGLCCKDGVIFGVEKFLHSKMLVPGTFKRVMPVHRQAGMAIAGLIPDGRALVSRARSEASSYKSSYNEMIPPNVLAERIGLYVHAHTLYWSVRPFGCSVLLGTVDEDKVPSLFSIEPSGHVFKYKGQAIGKGQQAGKTELEKLYAANPNGITCKAALKEIAKIICKIHDEKDPQMEVECSWICSESGYQHQPVPADELTKVVDAVKAELEAEAED